MYDIPNQRIQIWKYDEQEGWMQIGKDIPVEFAEGDVFTIRTGKNSAIEVYQNGKLLEKHDTTTQSIQFVSYQLPQAQDISTETVASYTIQAQSNPVTITYDYDPLYRLTEANYSNGDYYHYGYDAVGNRLSQDTLISGLQTMTAYDYDNANRLTIVNGVTYTWDNNGNLLSDGVNTYTYDSANRLKTMSNQSTVSSYQYTGLGDRLRQTVNGVTTNYMLDLNTGLTQVLDDGTNTYVYGVGRIAQANGTTTEYFLGDALGSVRQLTDASGNITLAKSYDSYGIVSQSVGSGASIYAYTGEQQDASGLTYLRARYYASSMGRFLTRDTWMGDDSRPLSLNRWAYVYGNPINLADPTGNHPGDHSKYCNPLTGDDRKWCERIVRGINPTSDVSLSEMRLYDKCSLAGDDCSCLTLDNIIAGPLHESLTHYINKDTAIQNGWWFHYLVDNAPGWWNKNGKEHAYFSTVIAFAIGAEMGSFRDYDFGLLLAHGFANKAWKEGFYRMLGGRQSATTRVFDAIYTPPDSKDRRWYRICGKATSVNPCVPFSAVASEFSNVLKDINLLLSGGGITNNVYDLGHMVLWHSNWRRWNADAPYEWGNPTEYSQKYDKLMNALGSPAGPWRDQVLYHSYPTAGNPIVAFVVSKNQADYLCDMHSCVAP